MKIIGCVLLGFFALLLLLLLLPLGAEASFGEKTEVCVRVGSLRIPPERLDALKKEKKPSGQSEKPKPPKKKRSLPKLTADELFDLIGTALHALGRALRRLCHGVRFDPLDVHATLGGDGDPAALAQNCGYANAALWTFMPQLETLFTIPDPCICIDADFEGRPTHVEGRVGVCLRPITLVVMALVLAWPLLMWYRRFKKAHQNDPVRQAKPEETEEKLSA